MVTTTTGIATEFIQFTRASNATVTDSDGLVKWAPHNLLTNSESFDAAAWTKASVTIAANNATAPNGTTTADTITLGAGTAAKIVYQTIASTAAQCVIGVYVKIASGTVRYVQLLQNFDGQSYANFDITGNAVGTKGANTPSSAITNVGADWYYITATFSGAGNAAWVQIVDGTSSAYNSATSATGTFHLWGAHLYRSDLGGMQPNTSAYPMYNPTTPKNLLGYTEDFNTGWSKQSVAINSTGVLAPNGLQTADLMYPSTTGNFRSVYQIVSGKTVSVYAKAAGKSHIAFVDATGSSMAAWFNLTTGVKGTVVAGYEHDMVSIGNGWYRCWMRSTSGAVITIAQYYVTDADNSTSVTANGTDGIYLWGAQLSDSASLDSYVPVYGAAVTSAAYYGPRRDFDPVTLAAKGLLVEEQRTNLVLNSATLSTQNATVTAVAHTLTFYGTGTITLSGTSTAGPLVGTGVNNRVSLTFTPTAGTLTLTVTGSVTQAQLEAGSFATSYIPTGAATATRNADVASVSTQAFPYSATEGTVVANGTVLATAASNRSTAISLYETTTTGVQIGNNTGNSGAANVAFLVNVSNVDQAYMIFSNVVTAGTPFKAGGSYKANAFNAAVNGTSATPDTSGSVPSGVTEMRIGRTLSTEYFNGHIRQITYLPRALTASELQTRTA